MEPTEACNILYFRPGEADQDLVRLLHVHADRLDVVSDREGVLSGIKRAGRAEYDLILVQEVDGLQETQAILQRVLQVNPGIMLVAVISDSEDVARATILRVLNQGCVRVTSRAQFADAHVREDLFAQVQGMKRRLEPFELYRELVEHSRDVISVLDSHGTLIFESPSVQDVLGYSPEKLMGTNPFDLVHRDDQKRALSAFMSGRSTSDAEQDLEYRFKHADGSWRVLESRAKNVRTPSGKHHIIVSSRDVTSRHVVMSKLQQRERQLSDAQRITHIGSWEWLVAEDVFHWSDEMYRIYGLEMGSPLYFERFLNAVHSEDRERVKSVIGAALEDQGPFAFNHRIVRPDGSQRTLFCQGEILIGDDGISEGVVGTGHDITDWMRSRQELQESEDMIRNLVDLAPDAILVFSRQGNVLDANPSACRLFNATSEWLMARTYSELKPVDRRDQARAEFQELQPGQEYRSERHILTSDGKEVATEHRIRLVAGSEDRVLLYLRDISARREREKALRNLSQRQEEAIERERKRISREVHDVLGQSLTALGMDVSWLARRDRLDRESRERLEEMKQRVDETLHTARKIAHELRPGILDDFGLAAAIDWQAHQFAKRNGVSARVGTLDHVDIEPEMATTFFRIFQELLTNITRHAEASEFEINLTQTGQNLSLSVRDNGKGMTTDDTTESTSLGLMGIRERLISWEGRLDIESTPGAGTRVEIVVPLEQTHSGNGL